MNARNFTLSVAVLAGVGFACGAPNRAVRADDLPTIAVEGQPLAANIIRLLQALEVLGWPFDPQTTESLRLAIAECDAEKIQRIVDSHVVCLVTINPESRVKVERGPGDAVVQQAGYTPLVVKVVNQGTVTARLSITSPQAGAPYAGAETGKGQAINELPPRSPVSCEPDRDQNRKQALRSAFEKVEPMLNDRKPR